METKLKSTGHKDFFGHELFVGDTVSMMVPSGNSVYLRGGVIVGSTPKMVKVIIQYKGELNTDKEPTVKSPHNLTKAYENRNLAM